MENPFEPGKKIKNINNNSNNRMKPSSSEDFSSYGNFYDQLNRKYNYKYDSLFRVLKFIDRYKWTITLLLFFFSGYYSLMFIVIFEKQIVEWFFKTFID